MSTATEQYRQYLVTVSIPIGVVFDTIPNEQTLREALVENFLDHPAIRERLTNALLDTYMDKPQPLGPWTEGK